MTSESSNPTQALIRLASLKETDVIVNVLSGTAGIAPAKAALKANKILLLGNKESIVADGKEIMKLANGNLIPLDSEHNAIYEILKTHPNKKIKSITLPCSGGPFLGKTKKELEKMTAKQALAHPKWSMGPKVTIESATLINKGLEVVEAHVLFNLPFDKIKVVIHPECQIHGMVEFESTKKTAGATKASTASLVTTFAYISPPDMREHIENALLRTINKTPPNREIRPLKPQEFALKSPDHQTFPGIKIVTEAFRRNPSRMGEFLKKEEKIISQFLQNEITFLEIFNKLSSF